MSQTTSAYDAPAPQSSVNTESDLHFYRNKTLDKYVQQKATPITLRQLIFYERHINLDRLLKSANYVRQELPIRISHRIREFQKLPFIVGTNPHIQHVYELYWQAFERLRKVPPITTLEENDAYCRILTESLESHLVVIPRLALGISECGQHVQPERIDRFMNATLRSRISRRVLAEQHLALSHQHRLSSHGWSYDDVHAKTAVFSSCSARETVAQCATMARAHYYNNNSSSSRPCPEVIIDGQEDDVQFTYIFDHIEYIIYQLLSNAFRHTLATHAENGRCPPPPIKVTICSSETDVLFRVSDQGGGMPAEIYKHLWSYVQRPHSRFGNFRDIPQLAARITEYDQLRIPLGIGLPMSRVYAEYWGGDINIVTMDGWGTDAYVRIPRFGTQMENIDLDHPEDGDVPPRPQSHNTSPIRRFVV